MASIKKEDLINGNILLSDWNKLQKESVAVIQNVRNAVDSGNRSSGNDPTELAYDLFFPETGEVKTDICESSGVTSEAKLISSEKAELFLEKQLHKNNKAMLALKKRNLSIRKAFQAVFKKEPVI